MSAIFRTPPPGCTCCINNKIYNATIRPSVVNKSPVTMEQFDPQIPSCCNICLEPLAFTGCEYSTRDRAVTLQKCGHVFGRTCLEKWLEDATTCPMCRVEVKESMEWTKNAVVESVFWIDSLREELANAMAETPLMHNLMERDSGKDDEKERDFEEGNDQDDDDWESGTDENDEKEDEKEEAEKGEVREQETDSRAGTAHFHGVRHIFL